MSCIRREQSIVNKEQQMMNRLDRFFQAVELNKLEQTYESDKLFMCSLCEKDLPKE